MLGGEGESRVMLQKGGGELGPRMQGRHCTEGLQQYGVMHTYVCIAMR